MRLYWYDLAGLALACLVAVSVVMRLLGEG